MAADSGTQAFVSGRISEVVISYVRMLEDVSCALPTLSEHVEIFASVLASVVDELVAYFEASHEHEKLADEARALCQELQRTMVYSDAYMSKVDNFAWHAKHKDRQKKVSEALFQSVPKFGPLNDYISHLKRTLRRAEESHRIFDQSGYQGVIDRLGEIMEDCRRNLTEEENKKLSIQIGGGLLAGGTMGASLATGGGLAALMAIPTAGIGSIIILGITGATVAVSGLSIGGVTAAATLYKAKQHERIAQAIKALSTLVAKIVAIAKSIKGIIEDVRLKLDGVGELIDDVDSEAKFLSSDSLMASLEQLYEKLNDVGDSCTKCHQKIKDKKQLLDSTIDKLLEC